MDTQSRRTSQNSMKRFCKQKWIPFTAGRLTPVIPMRALLDTSFLFALSNRNDRNHQRVLAVSQNLSDDVVLPTVILPEISYLIASIPGHHAMRQFVLSLTTQVIHIEPIRVQDLIRAYEVLEHYADSKLDFADSVIVATAERLAITHICTLDRRDFSIIRPKHCNYFELLP